MDIIIGVIFILLITSIVYLTSKNNKIEAEIKMMKADVQYYQSLFDNHPDAVISFDNQGVVIHANKMIENYGYSYEDIKDQSFVNYVASDQQENTYNHYQLAKNGTPTNFESSIIDKSGNRVEIAVTNIPITVNNHVVGISSILRNITELKDAEKTVEYMAYHDEITGLKNRYFFNQQIEKNLLDKQTKKLAILYFDLDRFKVINDSMGHDMGDRLLKAVSNRLRAIVSDTDCFVRNGGDEFSILVLNSNHQVIEEIANQILACFTEPFILDQYEIYTTPSIGISIYPDDGIDAATLLKKADSAMYQAKRFGNTYHFYGLNKIDHNNEKLRIEMELRRALECEEFFLHYQPKIDLLTGKVKGVEALVRWLHPEKGVISPVDFIPLAEETGLIIPIGEWVLRKACIQNKAWQEAGFTPLIMSVNLSVRQLYQPNLVKTVKQVLEETGLSAEYLILELTESMLMDSKQSMKVLQELKRLGVRISLDDFGTGFSSLHYLKEFPIDKLKVDQAFIRNSNIDGHDAALVKTIIAMARQLNIEVVAEGIEEKEHLIFLQRQLCNEGQGFLFSKPLPPEELIRKIPEIEQIMIREGLPQDSSEKIWMEGKSLLAREELEETIRHQKGLIFKVVKDGNKFVHTLAEGELLQKMGFSPEHMIGKELHEFYPDEIAREKTGYYERAWNGEENISYETTINGISYMAHLRPVRKGSRVVEIIGNCTDITERKQMEEALALSEANFRLIAENTSDLIGIWGKNGHIEYASPSHKNLLGFLPTEYQGKLGNQWIHPDDYPILKHEFDQMFTTRTPTKIHCRAKHANGKWLLLEAQINPVTDEENEVQHFVVVGRDITMWKNVVDELTCKTPVTSTEG